MEIEYKRVGDVEHMTANGTPEEMAAFVVGLKKMPEGRISIHGHDCSQEERERMEGVIHQALLEDVENSQKS